MIEREAVDTTLDGVIEGLRLEERFGFHVVSCAGPAQVEHARARLVDALGDQAVALEVRLTDLGDPSALVDRLLQDTPRGVLVLSATVMDAQADRWSLVFQRLNEARNHIKSCFDGLVLLLPTTLKSVFTLNAQDFFSWRSSSVVLGDDQAPMSEQAPLTPADAKTSDHEGDALVAREAASALLDDDDEFSDDVDEEPASPAPELVTLDRGVTSDPYAALRPEPEPAPELAPEPEQEPESKSEPAPAIEIAEPEPNDAAEFEEDRLLPRAHPVTAEFGPDGEVIEPNPVVARPRPVTEEIEAAEDDVPMMSQGRPVTGEYELGDEPPAAQPPAPPAPPARAPAPMSEGNVGAVPPEPAKVPLAKTPEPMPAGGHARSWGPRFGGLIDRLWGRLSNRHGGRGLDPQHQPLRVLLLSSLRIPDRPRDSRVLEKRMRWMMEDLAKLHPGPKHECIHLVVVAGDVAASGRPSEFERARVVLRDLVAHLGTTERRPALVLAPGNHDVGKGLPKWRNPIERGEMLDDTMRQRNNMAIAREGVGGFRGLVQQLHDDGVAPGTAVFEPHLLLSHELEHGERKVAVRALDTAWGMPWAARGTGLLGSQQLESALAGLGEADLRIAVVHHPPARMDPAEWALLRESFDLVLTGPRHDDAPQAYRDGSRALVVSGAGLLGANDDRASAGYALLELGLVARVHLRWVDAGREPVLLELPLGHHPER